MSPGWKTSEFWLNVGSQLIGALVIFGVLKPEAQQPVAEGFVKVVGAVGVLISQGLLVMNYVKHRTDLKKTISN